MKISAIFGVSLLLGACAGGQKAHCNVDPVVFCAPFEELEKDLSAREKDWLLQATPPDIIKLHRGFGTHIRNRFGLWEDNEITHFFNANGVNDADNMSGPFMTGFIGYLRGQPVVMTQEIKKLSLPPPPPPR